MPDPTATSSKADDLDALIARGGDLLKEEQVEEARGCFDDALKLDPVHEKALGLLGLTHFRLADFESATVVYEKLVGLRPRDASYRLNLGLVHLKLDRPVDAIVELAKSRELDPSQIRTVSYLGLAYARNGEYEDAYEAFLRAEQDSLAAEMEQYLDKKTCQRIRSHVSGIPSDGDSSESSPEQGEVPPVLHDEPASPESSQDVGMITQAVEVVKPSEAAAVASAAKGHMAPEAVSAFATRRLLRPSEGGETFEIGAGGMLIAQVRDRLISRTEGVVVSSGELGFEPATRRIRGKASDEVFGSGNAKLYSVTGQGYLLASANGECFTALRLDDDIVYLREECVFAFDPGLRWENGRIPGSEFLIAQFRGTGCVAVRTPKEPISVKLSSDRVMYVDSEVLAGWIGRVVPRLIKPAAGGRSSSPFVECSGEGIVLLYDMQGDS